MNKIFTLLFILTFLIYPELNAQKKKKENKTETPKTERTSLTFSKYKSAWQVGVFGGVSTLMGDVKPNFFYGAKPALPGHNFGVFVSKSWSYLFSTRLKYSTMTMFTTDAAPSTLTSNQYAAIQERSSGLNGFSPGDLIFHNSRTQGHDINLDLVFSVGNINFHKDRSTMVFKVFPSVGMMMYQSFYDHLDANGDAYDYESVENLNSLGSVSRAEVIKALSTMRDGKYETKAEEHTVDDENKLLGYNPRFVFGLGAGVAFRLTDYMSLDIETRQMLSRDDLIDGMQWQEPDGKTPTSRNLTSNFDSYNQTTVGLTFSLIGKNIAESKNMDNPFAGNDAFSKKTTPEPKKDEEIKIDSTNILLNEKVENLEEQINGLELLIKMMAQAKENQANKEEQTELEREKEKLEDEANRLKENETNIETNEGSSNSNTGSEEFNDLGDETFKHRNGDYIFLANLSGEISAAYYLIIGSFRVKSNANKDQRKWTDKGINTIIMTDVESGLYRLVVDYTNDHSEALNMLDKYQVKLNKEIWLIKQK